MNLYDTMRTLTATAQDGVDRGECLHVTFQHLAGLDGWPEVEETYLAVLYGYGAEIFAAEQDGDTVTAERVLGDVQHALVLLAAIGYAAGSVDAFDTFQAAEERGTLHVPDTLAALDLLGDE